MHRKELGSPASLKPARAAEELADPVLVLRRDKASAGVECVQSEFFLGKPLNECMFAVFNQETLPDYAQHVPALLRNSVVNISNSTA